MNTKKMMIAILFTPGPKGRWGLPVIFEGQPGTGKTSVIESIASEHGLACEVIIGSIREPADVGGLAKLEADCFRLMPASWARGLVEKQHGLLFLDELNSCAPAMQSALLRTITDGAVGELMLPPTVRILAAQNKTEEAAGGWDLAPPLANRFLHMQWDPPSAMDWATWLLGSSEEESTPESAAKIEARVLKNWSVAFARAKGLVTSFLRANPSLLHKMPPAGSPEASRAWPSPRTWELATRAIAGADVHGLDEAETDTLIAAAVGIGAAAELAQYRAHADLPDPASVLDGGVTFTHDPQRLDRTAAVLSACAALIIADKSKRKERASALWRIIATVSETAADIVIQAAVVLAQNGMIHGSDAQAALARLQPVLAASGFVAKRQ